MLAYRHIFHAGNFADVVKHIVLTLTIEYLKKKHLHCPLQTEI